MTSHSIGQSSRLISVSLAALLGVMALGAFWLSSRQDDFVAVVAQVHDQAGAPKIQLPLEDFELSDQNQKKFSARSQLGGKVWLASFIFTSCGGVCPNVARQVKRALQGRPSVGAISVTVDPENDGPKELKEFAHRHGADLSRWSFLYGQSKQIEKVMVNHFKLGFAEDLTAHSDRIVLVDRNFKIRGFYAAMEPEAMKALSKDLDAVLGE